MKTHLRHRARRLALQAIYQWEINRLTVQETLSQLLMTPEQKIDQDYFSKLVNGVIKNYPQIDVTLQQVLDRPLSDLTDIELAVLRIAVFELEHCLDVPYRVVINEALELTKLYGTQEGYKYVNGVLDKLAKQMRENEYERI